MCPIILVKEHQATEFIHCIDCALLNIVPLEKIRQLHLLEYNSSLVISFDAEYNPFLGYSRGYNPPEQREYLRDCYVLNEIKIALNEVNTSESDGGRIFLNSKEARRKLNDGRIISICSFLWMGEDPVKKYVKIKKLLWDG